MGLSPVDVIMTLGLSRFVMMMVLGLSPLVMLPMMRLGACGLATLVGIHPHQHRRLIRLYPSWKL